MPSSLPIQLLTLVGASFGRGPICRRESREIVCLATRPLSGITGYRPKGEYGEGFRMPAGGAERLGVGRRIRLSNVKNIRFILLLTL
jgi:hypothetical protein